jgi:putative peptidoglycan lipid II flippase
MGMIVFSRLLGLVRQRVLAHYFNASELSLFFAAFRLPDTLFEVLVFGTFASAFIPVFTKLLKKEKEDDHGEAWKLAGVITNWGGLLFIILAVLFIALAHPIYKLITPGFGSIEQEKIVEIARILFAAQGFFVVSYVLTAVLESSKRFLIPALAPLFYNLGIIVTTILFAQDLHLMAPTIGVVIGALSHFLVQMPFAYKLGFRFTKSLEITTDVKKIVKLAIPRILEVSFLQVSKFVELTLATLISVPAYTYYMFGNTIQLLPVGLFGTAIAKAALPTLVRKSDDLDEFKKVLYQTLNQIMFLMTPVVAFLMVARVPVVRLIFGTDIFTWDATVQTSLVVSAFAFGIFAQSINAILARSFYALTDTKTPVIVSSATLLVNIVIDYLLVVVYKLPVWSLAAAFSFSSIIQSFALYILMSKRVHNGARSALYLPVLKCLVAGLTSGITMFFILKFFDKSVWIKKVSFISNLNLPFENFVLDTRYAGNLLILTVFVGITGLVIYILILKLLKSKELDVFWRLINRMFTGKTMPDPQTENPTV